MALFNARESLGWRSLSSLNSLFPRTFLDKVECWDGETIENGSSCTVSACRMIDTSRDKAATCQYWSTMDSDIVTRVKHPFIPYRVHPIRVESLTTPWDQWKLLSLYGQFVSSLFNSNCVRVFSERDSIQIVWRSRSTIWYVRTRRVRCSDGLLIIRTLTVDFHVDSFIAPMTSTCPRSVNWHTCVLEPSPVHSSPIVRKRERS